ncbi:MAG: low molecular weight phosphatase family protein [Alphaproteobacteria bacterium]|nr:low molecular weight phosphatase family protein [Alphaproteobacteria bacterium]
MAAAIMRHLFGHRVAVDSVGVLAHGEVPDGFAVAVMAELGLDIAGHEAKPFDTVDFAAVDHVVTFTPCAHHRALQVASDVCVVEYWPLPDPVSDEDASRDDRLAACRALRETLLEHIGARFPAVDAQRLA